MTTLALVPLLVPVAVGLVNAIAWLIFGHTVIRPWMDEQYSGKTPWWKRLTAYPLRWARSRLRAIEERIKSEMSYRFLQTSPAVSRWLHRQARTMEYLSGVIVSSNEATFKALTTLRRTTIPTMLAAKVEPIWERLERLSERMGVTEGRVQDAGQLITGTLTLLPWGHPTGFVPALDSWLGSYRHLWNQTFNFIQPRLNEVWTVRIPDIWERLDILEAGGAGGVGGALGALRKRVSALEDAVQDNILPRLAKLEAALAPAALAVLVLAALRVAAPNLFCRNVTSTTRRMCAQDEGLWEALLAGTMIFALALNPREVAAAGSALTGILGSVIAETVDH